MDDTFNELSAKVYARGKDTPAKRWWHLDTWHPGTGRALRIDRQEGPEAFYALLPFRLTRIEGVPVIAAAYPTPHFLTDVEDWLGIETVLLWNPVTNMVSVDGDTAPQLVGNFGTSGTIYADPRAFFQAWARQRAQFYVQRRESIMAHWTAPLPERDDAPGMLIVGDAQKIHWPIAELPEVITTVGIDAKTINRAIFKSARLPRVQDNLRAVA